MKRIILIIIFLLLSCDNSFNSDDVGNNNFDLSKVYGKWANVAVKEYEYARSIESVNNGIVDSVNWEFDTTQLKEYGLTGYPEVLEFTDIIIAEGSFQGYHQANKYYPNTDTTYRKGLKPFLLNGNYFDDHIHSDTSLTYTGGVYVNGEEAECKIINYLFTEISLVNDTLRLNIREEEYLRTWSDDAVNWKYYYHFIELEQTIEYYVRIKDEELPPTHWPQKQAK